MFPNGWTHPSMAGGTLVLLGLAATSCGPDEGPPPGEIRLVAAVVLEFPDGVEFGGPARIFANQDTYAVVDVTGLQQMHFFSSHGEFRGTVGPIETSASDPARVSSAVFHADGSVRILSGRGQRAFLVDRDLDDFVEMPFAFESIWDAVPLAETELVVNAPTWEPGAAGQPLHRISETGEILDSFGHGPGDRSVSDVGRHRWPIADEVVNGAVLAVDPRDLSTRRFSFSGEPVGDPGPAPDALLSLLPEGDATRSAPPIIPLKSWQGSTGPVWSLTWVPSSHLGDAAIEVEPCPLPRNHTVMDLGAPPPVVSVIDVRDPEERGAPPIAAFECRLLGILSEGRVYLTVRDETSGRRAIHLFTLELGPPSRSGSE